MMSASYAATGTVTTTLTDAEARRFAELTLATGAPAEPLARWVLAAVERLERLRLGHEEIETLRAAAENRAFADRYPTTHEAIVKVLEAQEGR